MEFSSIYYVLVMFSLVVTNNVLAEYTEKQYDGRKGDSFTVASPNYARMTSQMKVIPYVADNSVHVFRFNNTDAKRDYITHILLHFTDFDINPKSVLKIRDGDGFLSFDSLFFHNSSRPIHLTSNSNATVVFKTGSAPANDRLGFRMVVEFLDASGTWPPEVGGERPSTGYCGDIDRQGESSGSSVIKNKLYDRKENWMLDCRYQKKTPRRIWIAVIPPNRTWWEDISKRISVIDFATISAGRSSVITPTKKEVSGILYIVYNVHESKSSFEQEYSFNMWITSRFEKNGDTLKWGYDSSESSAMANARTADSWARVEKPCPYKECPSDSKSSFATCKSYVEPCNGIDATCDLYDVKNLAYVRCGDSSGCFHIDLDTCDGFTDCVHEESPRDDNTEEFPCEGDDSYNYFGIFGFALFVVLACVCDRGKHRPQCSRGGSLSDCVGNLCTSIGACFMGILCCLTKPCRYGYEQVKECCETTPVTTTSPATTTDDIQSTNQAPVDIQVTEVSEDLDSSHTSSSPALSRRVTAYGSLGDNADVPPTGTEPPSYNHALTHSTLSINIVPSAPPVNGGADASAPPLAPDMGDAPLPSYEEAVNLPSVQTPPVIGEGNVPPPTYDNALGYSTGSTC